MPMTGLVRRKDIEAAYGLSRHEVRVLVKRGVLKPAPVAGVLRKQLFVRERVVKALEGRGNS